LGSNERPKTDLPDRLGEDRQREAAGVAVATEPQRQGIAKAEAEGKYKGRKATARAKAEQARGANIGATEIACRLSIDRRASIGC
jgi:hypothetical protein